MITCQRCQTENLEGSQYCDECGAVMPGSQHAPRKLTSENGESASMEAPAPPEDGARGEGEGGEAPLEEAHPATAGAQVSAAAKSAVISPVRTSAFGRAHEESAPPRRGESSAAPHAKFVIHRGRSVGKEFPLCEEESHIGRWDADGGIFPDVDLDSDDPEAKVSRRHARITRRGEQYYIEDLGSTNGTFVNRGRRLLPGDRQPLRDGDEVIVGKTFLKFQVIKS